MNTMERDASLPGRGPFPIFCRGHSGGRLLCEAFIRNGMEMGEVSPERKDTSWFADTNPEVHRLAMNSFRYPTLPPEEKAHWQRRTHECVEDYARNQIRGPGPFGWKMGFTLFMMPMVLDAFPSARAVHLVRDGRDVMLSRLNARMRLQMPLNRLVVFGDENVTTWRGAPLDAATVEAHRTELEMQHWVTAVNFGLQGRAYGERYLEVRYEDLCADPFAQCADIFAFLDLPFLPETEAWLAKSVYRARIGKWRHLPREEIEAALAIGADLLQSLGYT